MPLLAEIVGRILWQSERLGVKFVGAMLAVGASVVGLWFLCVRVVKVWHNDRNG